MTARELIDAASAYRAFIVVALLIPPIAALALRFAHERQRGGKSPWKYFYAVLVYATCVPGIFATTLTAYALFFTGENLLDLELTVFVLPVVCMAVALILIGRNVEFDRVPGFDRLSGLMVMIALAFAIVLAISRTRIWLFFGGSIFMLFAIAGFAFAIMKWGTYMAFRRRDEPDKPPPSFGG